MNRSQDSIVYCDDDFVMTCDERQGLHTVWKARKVSSDDVNVLQLAREQQHFVNTLCFMTEVLHSTPLAASVLIVHLISSFLSSCHEKATEAPYIGQIQTRLGSDFFVAFQIRFHRAGIIIVKYLIQGRNNETWVGVEPSALQSWLS